MKRYIPAFNDNADHKKLILDRVSALQKQGHRSQTLYFHEGIASSYNIGIPVQIAYVAEEIFKNLKGQRANRWPYDFFNSINVGADLRPAWPRFAYWLLSYSDVTTVKRIRNHFLKGCKGGRVRFTDLRILADKALEKPISRAAGYAAYACTDPKGPTIEALGNGLHPCPSGAAECVDSLGRKGGRYSYRKQAFMLKTILMEIKGENNGQT